MRTEADIIKRIWNKLPTGGVGRRPAWLRLGVGDDAAVLRAGGVVSGSRRQPTDLVLSCDAFLENIHFLADVHPPDAIGYKALARATSDLAAMGAAPKFFMLSCALPDKRTGKWLDDVLVGMARAARQFGMVLIGGDTSRNATVVMNFTVGGEVAPGRALTRSGARPGDGIYISGTLGAAQLGLELILRGVHKQRQYKSLLEPHLRPQIQLELGRWLAGENRRHAIASAAIDTSDGLSSDLTHICQASGVGAQISAAQIPTVEIPKSLRGGRFDSLHLALHGGEDYQLLFTVPQPEAHRIPRAMRGTRITKIGEIVSTKPRRGSHPIELVDASGRKTPLIRRGWDSFRVSRRDR
jgi:thiamine-monophosphate kinase